MTGAASAGEVPISTIRERARKAGQAVWRAVSGQSSALLCCTIASNALRMLSTIILTRLLLPSAFGETAIVTSTFFILAMLTDLGFQAFVVRHVRGDDQHFLDSIWTIHAARGGVLFVVAALISAPIAGLLRKPELAPLLAAASLTLAIDGLISFRTITAIRNGQIARLSYFELGISGFQTCCSIVFVVLTRSVWGIIAAMIVTSALRSASSYLVFHAPRHRFRPDRVLAGEMWVFSRPIMASSMLSLAIAQTDKLVLARAFSLSDFGIYGIAAGLATAPLALAHGYANRILYSRYTAAERAAPGGAGQAYYARALLFFGYLAGAGALIGVAPSLVHALYDPRYYGAARFLSILAVATAMVIVTQSAANLFVAVGRSRYVFETNIVRVIWLAAAAPLALSLWGPIGIVAVLGLIEAPAYGYCLWRLRGLGVLRWGPEMLGWGLCGAGFCAGGAVNAVVERLLPHL